MASTEGRGVNIILNSVVGELTEVSLSCLAEEGRFLELENADFLNNNLLEYHEF